MNIVSFGEGACGKTRRYLDSYISNELLVETNHEVLRHLESCPACAAEAEARSRLKTQLKSAVSRESMPAHLPALIREQIRQESGRSLFAMNGFRWAAAAAAVLVMVFGTVWSVSRWRDRMPELADRRGQDVYIQRVSQTIANVLKVGLGDHIHCSIFRKYPEHPPTLEQMAEKMGPAYNGLVTLVKARVPEDYQIIMAHQCGYAGRRYIHLTLRNGANLISLVVARKEPGESLEKLQPTQQASGVAIYQAAAQQYEVAGFETDRFMAFVVSDLNSKTNLQLAADIAPAVHAFLSHVQG